MFGLLNFFNLDFQEKTRDRNIHSSTEKTFRFQTEEERNSSQPTPDDTGCSRDEFVCGNGRCVAQKLRCNQQDDCGDGTDEHGCHLEGKCENEHPDGSRGGCQHRCVRNPETEFGSRKNLPEKKAVGSIFFSCN